jgi:MFS family permease/predicted transcriptional regulator
LAELLLRDGIRQDEVASDFRCDKVTAARAIQHLERNGYVERRQSVNDGRVKMVFVTDKARELEPVLFSFLEEWTDTLFQGFSTEERERTLRLLHRIVITASKIWTSEGVRKPFIISLICYGLAGGSGLLINSYGVLLVSRACLGIALSGIFVSLNVLILNRYTGGERDMVMGWRGSAQSFGGVIWPLTGGALGAVSWHLPFAIYMLAIPIGLLAMRVVAEPAAQHLTGSSSANDTTVFKVLKQNPILLPTVMVWIRDIVPPAFRGRFSSYLGTFGFIGQFLSPILFAPILIMAGLKGVFVVGAGIGVSWLFLSLLGLRYARSSKPQMKGD